MNTSDLQAQWAKQIHLPCYRLIWQMISTLYCETANRKKGKYRRNLCLYLHSRVFMSDLDYYLLWLHFLAKNTWATKLITRLINYLGVCVCVCVKSTCWGSLVICAAISPPPALHGAPDAGSNSYSSLFPPSKWLRKNENGLEIRDIGSDERIDDKFLDCKSKITDFNSR